MRTWALTLTSDATLMTADAAISSPGQLAKCTIEIYFNNSFLCNIPSCNSGIFWYNNNCQEGKEVKPPTE